MKRQNEIIADLITSKTIKDYVTSADISNMDLSMILIRDPFTNITKLKSYLEEIHTLGLEFLYTYYTHFFEWFDEFQKSDDDTIYVLDERWSGQESMYKKYFKNYSELMDTINDCIKENSKYDESPIYYAVKAKIGSDDIDEQHISFVTKDIIASSSFYDEDLEDSLYAADTSKLFPLHSIVKSVYKSTFGETENKFAIVTAQWYNTLEEKPDMLTGSTINIEGIQYGCSLWYDHVNPQCYELVDENCPEFSNSANGKLLLEMRSRVLNNDSFYNMLCFFKQHEMRLSGIDG